MSLANIPALPSDEVVVIGDRRFNALHKALQFIHEQPEEERYQWQRELGDYLTRASRATDDVVEAFYEYVCADGSWRRAVTKNVFLEETRELQDVVIKAAKGRNRQEEARRRILGMWGQEAEGLLIQVMSFNLLVAVRRCALKCSLKETLLGVNQRILHRRLNPKSGVSTTPEPLAGDFDHVLNKRVKLEPVKQQDLRKVGLCMGRIGLVELGDQDQITEGLIVASPSPEEDEGPEVEESPDPPEPETEGPLKISTTLPPEDGGLVAVEEDGSLRFDLDNNNEISLPPGNDEFREVMRTLVRGDLPVNKKDVEGACGCSEDVPIRWHVQVQQRPARPISEGIRLLKDLFRYETVCNKHRRDVAFHLGLKTHGIDLDILFDRLRQLWTNWQHLGKFKVRKETGFWFRRRHRPTGATDDLGPYKFRVQAPTPFSFERNDVLKGLNVWPTEDPNDHATLYPFTSTWWGKKSTAVPEPSYSIRKILDYEFGMYQHHSRVLNGKENLGWVRTMLHSLSQQLLRQDPVLYLITCHHRLDGHWRFVSYPYYSKERLAADTLLYEQLGIRSSSPDCPDHGLDRLNQPVDPIPNDYWVVSDEMRASEDNTPRRNMSPWFVGLQEDLEQLEVPEMGTWSQLAEAHRNLEAPRPVSKSVSRRFVTLPFRFPAAVELSGLSPLSDALVCRARWDSPAVLAERDLLLGPDRDAAAQYVHRWRARARERMNECFEHLWRTEQEVFGERSYFYCLDQGLDGWNLPEDLRGADVSDDESSTEGGEPL